MQIINISKKKFDSLVHVELGKEITNTEAIIYLLDYRGKEKVFKNLHRLSGSIFANKLYTLEMLSANSEYLPSGFVVPDALCTVNGNIMGCIEDYVNGVNLQSVLNNPKIDLKIKLHYIKLIGNILEQLKHIRSETPLKDIYLNDLHAGNFIVTTNGELKTIDLDSCKICDNKPFPSKYLYHNGLLKYSNKYNLYKKGDEYNGEYEYRTEFGYVEADENSDLYCYIMTILNFLYSDNVGRMNIDEFFKYLNYLSSIGISKSLTDSFSKIVNNCDNTNPRDAISNLTYEQVARANKKVYKLVA